MPVYMKFGTSPPATDLQYMGTLTIFEKAVIECFITTSLYREAGLEYTLAYQHNLPEISI